MTLMVLRGTDQVFCRMSLSLDLSDVFLMIRQGYGIGEEDHRVEVPSSSIILGVHAIEGTY